MAEKSQVPWYLPWANRMVKTLLRAGVKLNGPGKAPMYLLTVRGRKSGQPRTTPVATLEQDGTRYLFAPFGVVDWVRNLRAAGEATFTRGRRSEQIRAIELSGDEVRPVVKRFIETGNPILRLFGVTKDMSQEEAEQLVASNPVFLLQTAPTPISAAA